jgi:hypothetical protein
VNILIYYYTATISLYRTVMLLNYILTFRIENNTVARNAIPKHIVLYTGIIYSGVDELDVYLNGAEYDDFICYKSIPHVRSSVTGRKLPNSVDNLGGMIWYKEHGSKFGDLHNTDLDGDGNLLPAYVDIGYRDYYVDGKCAPRNPRQQLKLKILCGLTIILAIYNL